MSLENHFPFFYRMFRALTGRWARRVYLAILLLVLLATCIARLRTYLIARKIQGVLHGLEQVRIDQTTEADLVRMVPYLQHRGRGYYANFPDLYAASIPDDEKQPSRWPVAGIFPDTRPKQENQIFGGRIDRTLYGLGFRSIHFYATVWIRDNKVSKISYGLAPLAVAPSQAAYIVKVDSRHTIWMPWRYPFWVSSTDDESPQFRIHGNKNSISATYMSDAPPEVTRQAYQFDLSCFWNLRGCRDAGAIAPTLWEALQKTQHETVDRVRSAGRCPETIVAGRMKYLPDLAVALVEVTGSRRTQINVEGGHDQDWQTDYKVIEVIRGPAPDPKSLLSVHFNWTTPDPTDPPHRMANQVWPQTQIGAQVLYFSGPHFSSCVFIPATPSALAIARHVPTPPKLPEDQIVTGLL